MLSLHQGFRESAFQEKNTPSISSVLVLAFLFTTLCFYGSAHAVSRRLDTRSRFGYWVAWLGSTNIPNNCHGRKRRKICKKQIPRDRKQGPCKITSEDETYCLTHHSTYS